MTELRRVNVDIKFPHLRAYLPSFPSPHVADGQQRQETANLVRPPWSLSCPAPTELAHSSSKCSAFDLGIFHFSDTLQTKNAIFHNLYHLICSFVSVSCELTPWIQSVHSSRARWKYGFMTLHRWVSLTVHFFVWLNSAHIGRQTDGDWCI